MKYIIAICATVLAISQIVYGGTMGYGFSSSVSPNFHSPLRKSYSNWHAPTSYSNYGPRRNNHYQGRGGAHSQSETHGLRTIQLYHQAAIGAKRSLSRRPSYRYGSGPSPLPPTSYIHDQTANNGQQIKIIKIVHEGAVRHDPHEYESGNSNSIGSEQSSFHESPNLKTIHLLQPGNDEVEHSASSGATEVKTIKIIHEAAHQHNNALTTPSQNYDYSPYSRISSAPSSNFNKKIIIKVLPEAHHHTTLSKEYETPEPNAQNGKYIAKSASDLETVRTLKILHAIATASGSSAIDLGNLDFSALGSGAHRGSTSVELDADDAGDGYHYDAAHTLSHEEPSTYANWW